MEVETDTATASQYSLKESYFRKLPMWVIDWYYSNNLHTEVISSIKKLPILHTKDELNVAGILVDQLFNNKVIVNKRTAPKAKKCCCLCGKTSIVNSAKQFCTQDGCNGKLKLILKVKKEAKRKPPKCKKKCLKCIETFDCVATALQKCKKCGEKLYILK
tara:strand:+ start:404 stop:883 length:480 start_codon:yes stop_codon:yes gene_type:complete